jgi:hypothetical protein
MAESIIGLGRSLPQSQSQYLELGSGKPSQWLESLKQFKTGINVIFT